MTIGNSVTSIGSGAFYGCTSLTSITFLGLKAPTTVGTDWIDAGTGIIGHAYASSNFPAPGSTFYGLTMGSNIPPTSPGNDNMVIYAGIIALLAVVVTALVLVVRRKRKKV
jgi:hypothetical protein